MASGELSGHFETICAERGPVCVYDRPFSADSINDLAQSAHQVGQTGAVVKLDGHDCLRVVSDGLEARVYTVPKEAPRKVSSND